MNAEVFAEWLRRQGHHVVRTESSYWYDQGPRVYQAFPYQWIIRPSDQEIQELLRQTRAVGLRYSTPLSAPSGSVSYHVVCEDDSYSLESLSRKARYDVRKGCKSGVVEPISFSRLADEGWWLRADTLERQGRSGVEGLRWWRRLCEAAEGLPGFEAWGHIIDGTLTAALLAFTCDGCCCILNQQSRTAYLANGVNNALTFVFGEAVLDRSEAHMIFYGLHSLNAPSSVDEFKFRMGYMPRPVRQRVVFHPWVAPLFNTVSHAAVRQIQRWQPRRSALAKAEGLVRFYLQGKRPLSEQTWPRCLADQQATLLLS